MGNKIYINDNYGAVFENDKLTAVYTNISEISQFKDENNIPYLEIEYSYSGYEEIENYCGDYVGTRVEIYTDTDVYKWSDYDIIISNNEINIL